MSVSAWLMQAAAMAPAVQLPQPGVTAGGSKAFPLALEWNPALWLIVALGIGAVLEAAALLVLARAKPATATRITGLVTWAVHPFTGPDGRPSFTKIVDLLIIGAFWSGAPIPEGVALLVIGSAHGTKVLLAIVDKLSWTLGESNTLARSIATSANTSTSTSTAHTVTTAEAAARGIDATVGRGPAGEPLRSNPPVANATTPAGEG